MAHWVMPKKWNVGEALVRFSAVSDAKLHAWENLEMVKFSPTTAGSSELSMSLDVKRAVKGIHSALQAGASAILVVMDPTARVLRSALDSLIAQIIRGLNVLGFNTSPNANFAHELTPAVKVWAQRCIACRLLVRPLPESPALSFSCNGKKVGAAPHNAASVLCGIVSMRGFRWRFKWSSLYSLGTPCAALFLIMKRPLTLSPYMR